MKPDGIRAITAVDPRADSPVQCVSRNDVRMQATSPELDVLVARTGFRDADLDDVVRRLRDRDALDIGRDG